MFRIKDKDMKLFKEATKELEKKIEAPDFLAVSGSRLYGTNRGGSDYDYRGFLMPPYEYLIGLMSFDDAENMEKDDTKVYSLNRFFYMLENGDPQCTELLFVPKDKIVKSSELYEKILENKSLFLSNVIYKRLMGFSNSEWRKALAEKFQFEKLSKSHEDTRLNLLNYLRERGAAKEEIDEMIEKFDSYRAKKLIPSVSNLGAKRKADYDKYGFCVSSASHSIRLMGELEELMTTGSISFPRPEADILRGIRQGEVSKEEAQEFYDKVTARAEKARDKSVLPDLPNRTATKKLYKEMVVSYLKTDERFLNA